MSYYLWLVFHVRFINLKLACFKICLNVFFVCLFKDFEVLISSEFQISRVKGDRMSIYLGEERRADMAFDAARPEFKHQVGNILAV